MENYYRIDCVHEDASRERGIACFVNNFGARYNLISYIMMERKLASQIMNPTMRDKIDKQSKPTKGVLQEDTYFAVLGTDVIFCIKENRK